MSTVHECPPLHIVAPSFDPATVGGAGVVLVELTRQFLKILPCVRIYLNPGAARLFPEWKAHITEVPVGALRGARPTAASLFKLEFLGSRALPPAGVDGVCWFPFGFITPAFFRGPAVATLFDTLGDDLPDALPWSERQFRRFILKRTARVARFVTASRFSQAQIRRHYGASADIIPLAPVPLPAPSTSKVPARPFVFYPANAWPHKNHRFLLQTWRGSPELKQRFSLVFTLGGGLGALASEIEQARAQGVDVIVTGRLSAEELAGCYQAAECLVFPSLYEGFGLPVHEALGSGCPALISDCAALPESVTADYPFVLSLQSEIWTKVLLANPRGQAADFRKFVPALTWRDCAQRYAELFIAATAAH